MTPTAYLFIDIDGVLNPYTDADLGHDWSVEQLDGYDLQINPTFGVRLGALPGVQVVWATTWIRVPASLERAASAYGFRPRLPRIKRELISWQGWADTECGKRDGLIAYLDGHDIDPAVTPVVWVDDMLGRGDLLWAAARGVHAIKTDDRVGLSDERVVRRILESLRVSDAVPVA